MKKKGFSLIEVIFAMVILASGLILLANSWGGSFLRIKKTKIANDVAALLERKMSEISIEFKDQPLDSIPDEKAEDFGPDYPNYSWKLEAKKFTMPDLSASLRSQQGGVDNTMLEITRLIAEHLSESIKEVKVSVIYKTKPKDIEFSATTYFMDYNKDIKLPNLNSGGETQ